MWFPDKTTNNRGVPLEHIQVYPRDRINAEQNRILDVLRTIRLRHPVFDSLTFLVKPLGYPSLGASPGIQLVAHMAVHDRDSDDEVTVRNSFEITCDLTKNYSKAALRDYVIEAVMSLLKEMMIHELKEMFTVNDQRHYDAHYDAHKGDRS